MNTKQNEQYSILMRHWPPRGFRCPFCSEIHEFPDSIYFPIGYRKSVDLFCENVPHWERKKGLMLQLWVDEGQSNIWQLFYSGLATKSDLAKDINIHFGKKHWAEWKIPTFISNEIWFVGKLGNSLPLKGAKYLPTHVMIFGLVFDDNVMEEICANNPPTITEDQIDKMFMSRNRFEARHRNGTVTYYTGGNITKSKPMVFMPRSYFRSTPFMDNYLSKKFELGILPEDAVEYLEWRRDASIHYPIDTA